MESIYNKIDHLINVMDLELIKLWECAENKMHYKYFDFFTAIAQLIDLLKQHSLVKNYEDKLTEYHHAIKDLFETEAKTIFHEILDKNDNTKEVTIKYIIHNVDEVGINNQIKRISINEHEYNWVYKGKTLKELNKNSKPFPLSRYSVLTDNCKTETDIISLSEQYFDQKKKIDVLFSRIYIDNIIQGFYQGYFVDYVKKLKKQSDIERKYHTGSLLSHNTNKTNHMENTIDVILIGFSTKREYLSEYFEVKAGESKYKPGTFLFECLKTVEVFENNLRRQLQDKKRELNKMHQINPKGGYMKKFKQLSLNDFVVPLFQVTGGKYYAQLNYTTIQRGYGQLNYSAIQEIKQAINEAQKNIKTKAAKKKTGGIPVTGFDCPLSPEKIKAIYYFMNGKQIRSDLSDFQAIFSNTPQPVQNPIKWLIKAQTGSRGNQMKLYFFLEKMLQRQPTSEDKRKAKKLFVDEIGEFLNPKMRKPKYEERIMYDEFENLLANIHNNK
jgi:hypothetical protein